MHKNIYYNIIHFWLKSKGKSVLSQKKYGLKIYNKYIKRGVIYLICEE